MLDPFTSSLPTELYPPQPDKPADSLAIKHHLASLLSEKDGQSYWSALVNFLHGKLDRLEFEAQTTAILNNDKLLGLHNALVFSILYNSTRPDSPSNPPDHPNLHTTGDGWHKRKRTPPAPAPTPVSAPVSAPVPVPAQPKAKVKVEEKDPKKRKLKEAVMALGQRERNRLKQLALLKDRPKDQHHRPPPAAAQQARMPPPTYLCQERSENVLNTPLASKMKISSSTLYQDYMRCQQAPLCAEAKQLPDFETLKDRMSLIAYDSGLVNGVEKAASSLALIALEVHLKTLLGDLLSLIRSDRSVVGTLDREPKSGRAQRADSPAGQPSGLPSEAEPPQASTSARPYQPPEKPNHFPAHPKSPAKTSSGPLLASQSLQSSSSLRLRDTRTQGLAPHLTARDFAALAEISPHAFVRAHPGALERLISTYSCSAPPSSTSSDEEEEPGGLDRTGLRAPDMLRSAADGWLSGASAGAGPSVLRRPGLKSTLGNRSASARLARTNSFSPRSAAKTAAPGRLLSHAYLPCRSLLDGFRACTNELDGTGAEKPKGWAGAKLKVTSNGQHRASEGEGRAHLQLNARAAQGGGPPDSHCSSPLLTAYSQMANGMNGFGRSPVLGQHGFVERRASAAHPVKSLAAELFPEEDCVADVCMNGTGGGSGDAEAVGGGKGAAEGGGREEQSGSESDEEEGGPSEDRQRKGVPRTGAGGVGDQHGPTLGTNGSLHVKIGGQARLLTAGGKADGGTDEVQGGQSMMMTGVILNGNSGSHHHGGPGVGSGSGSMSGMGTGAVQAISGVGVVVGGSSSWERIDTFRLLENVGN